MFVHVVVHHALGMCTVHCARPARLRLTSTSTVSLEYGPPRHLLPVLYPPTAAMTPYLRLPLSSSSAERSRLASD